ncbi:PucR family transcriptional regulator ligand-binding domain-containing protein [Brevibacillus composti]|uniref:PucR family transcriptional regulator ligand-binding domain-containing protein n=1 Tax=Brevibacillus composti TaxID=2796470 RepID=A0A7T5JR04_9BACL|nr:PucR family transcriptional regulator ligand-binding domain-containing protein [Brevibacillus composti]QUO43793.1 PucR family transcriptional regulator ligand-binding domain-containing protein [Brevibacillus composti]
MAGIEGLKNEIYYVDSMEIPDLTGWLRPNELIISTGYSFRHEPYLLCRLLDEMHRVKGAAIAIKTKRFLQEIPEEALRKSDRYRIPLIDIPAEIPSIDLTHSVMENILNRQVTVMKGVQEVSQQFTQLVLNRRSQSWSCCWGSCSTAMWPCSIWTETWRAARPAFCRNRSRRGGAFRSITGSSVIWR